MNKVFLKNLINKVALVAFGALSIKLAMFFVNMVLVKNLDNPNSSDVSKIISLLFSSASVLYFSSSRYIAKSYLVDGKNLLYIFNIGLALIYFFIPVLFLFFYFFIEFELRDTLVFIVFIVFFAKYDLLLNVLNALGMTTYAALGQFLMASSLVVGGLALLLDFDKYYNFIYILIFISSFLFYYFAFNKIKNKYNLDNQDFLFELKNLIKYSIPNLITTMLLTPLVLWSVLFISNLSDRDYVLFVSALNFLGLAMLLPGQVNTAVFSILAKSSNKGTGVSILLITLTSGILSILSIYYLLPFFSFIYGENIELIKGSIFWIVMSCLPFIVIQYLSLKLFLSGRPWVDAKASILFAGFFMLACLVVFRNNFGIYEISICLFLAYLVKSLYTFFEYLRMIKS